SHGFGAQIVRLSICYVLVQATRLVSELWGGGRRMAERAAYLVNEISPRVPVRQWVLTLPYRLRYRLAWDHTLCRAVPGVYARALLAFYARSTRAHRITGGQKAAAFNSTSITTRSCSTASSARRSPATLTFHPTRGSRRRPGTDRPWVPVG